MIGSPAHGPEDVGLSERCLLGFNAGPPMLPSAYNNNLLLVQTPDTVVLFNEMIHDARIVRMNSEHPGPEVQRWLGDSIGWWEDDTLVVETTNFMPQWGLRGGGSKNKRVVERFTPMPGGDVLYRFTVEDDSIWSAPWTGETVWRASEDKIYEYACHEGNYAMTNVLRGARLLEQEALAETADDPGH